MACPVTRMDIGLQGRCFLYFAAKLPRATPAISEIVLNSVA
jgi:hypothetical protein